MKLQTRFKKAMLVGCALLVTTFVPHFAVGAEGEYSFKVTNKTKNTITKLLASEDGEKYGSFDIGKGIKPGETMTLVWDKSTGGSKCKQFFKAVYDDGSESDPTEFDFCEKELELEFD
jgi:hypothetical protein